MSRRAWRLVLALLLVAGARVNAQQGPTPPTADEDHRRMMELLGIRALRPGPSADATAPNAANYDESRADPHPELPPLLVLDDGRDVTTPAMWWSLRRPQLVEHVAREIYGRVPAGLPPVQWHVTRTVHETSGDTPTIVRHLAGHVADSTRPELAVSIALTLVLPANAPGPVPVLIMFGRAAQPKMQVLLDGGWGYALLDPSSVQADNGAGLTRGIIGLANGGQPRRPDDWGALRAWAWGASRVLDHLETEAAVDAQRVGIEGVSRFGKAALVAMAFDERFAVALIGSSGKGGTTLHRRHFGEAVESLAGRGAYHWMAGNYLRYAAADATFGSRDASALPVDSHALLALCAPRAVFISYGIPERGDAHWLDHQGSYMAAVAAQPVYRLLGARALGVSDDYRTERMPAVNVGLLDGRLAWRQHDGGHTDAPNMPHFIAWADRVLARPVGRP